MSDANIGLNIDVDETEDAIKTSPGDIVGWFIFNAAAAAVYVKFYDATVADTVVGTTVPRLVIPIPGGSASNIAWETPLPFYSAITIAATTGPTTADVGAPAPNQVIANVRYS
jgi:hypothetical protein